jgi:hypothetical protein
MASMNERTNAHVDITIAEGQLGVFKSCRLRLKCDGTRAETRFRLLRNGRVHLNRRGRQFSRLLAAEVRASAVVMVVMLDKPCSEEV